jgi:hypothetical protein
MGVIVTPKLPTYVPEKLTFSHNHLAWTHRTFARLKQAAADLNLRHNSTAGVGDTWLGHSGDMLSLACSTADTLSILLETAYSVSSSGETTMEEWLEDVDWDEHLNPDTSAGAQSWNAAHAVQHATHLAACHVLDDWQWDDAVAPSSAVLRRVTMNDVVLVAPRRGRGQFSVQGLLHDTKGWCAQWALGLQGEPGSAMHYAGLIACQASQTRAPDGETRYAETLS